MKKSFLGSVSLHALIVLAALFGVQTAQPFELKPVEAIQVDISNITDSTKVKAQSKAEEKPVEKPKAKESKSVEKTKPQEKVTEEKKVAAKEPPKAEPPPPKVEEKKVEDAPVDPDPLKDMLAAEEAELKLAEEQKKKDEAKKKKDEAKKKKAEEEKLKKEEEAKEKAKADAKKKLEAEKKAKKLDVAKLEDLLNKEIEESSAPVEQKDESGTPEKAEKDIQGNDEAMSATIIDGLRQRFSECWDVPPSVRETKETVDLKWSMTKQGRVVDQPVVIGGSGGAVAQQAAVAAVMACAPYDWLPVERYDLWKEIEWTFAPR
jgi:TolA protein